MSMEGNCAIKIDPELSSIESFLSYSERLKLALESTDFNKVETLAETLLDCWKKGKRVFICGNGGSAGNAVHIANDFLYGVSKKLGFGIKAEALSANTSIMTCLANDEGYEEIFSHQLFVQAEREDVLIAFSGSGNSPNIIKALAAAKEIGMKTFAILGFSGGKAKELVDVAISYQTQDMQISEDLQVIVCHMIMQWLYNKRSSLLG